MSRPKSSQFALLSLPSCGTDWLAKAIVARNPSLVYYREFFNPICNLRHYNELASSFGCELYETVSHLAQPIASPTLGVDREPFIANAYESTWLRESIQFTKENFSAFIADFYVERFTTFILYRPWEMCFPPSRLRVYSWYSAMFSSLFENADHYHCPDVDASFADLFQFIATLNPTPQEKCVLAHHAYFHRLLTTAQTHGITPIRYSILASAQSLDVMIDHLAKTLPPELGPRYVANDLWLSRDMNRVNRESKFQHEWRHCEPLARELERRFPLPIIQAS